MWLIESRVGQYWGIDDWADLDGATFFRDKNINLPPGGKWVQPNEVLSFRFATILDAMQQLGWLDDEEDFQAVARMMKVKDGQLDSLLTAAAKHMGVLTEGKEQAHVTGLGSTTKPHWQQNSVEQWAHFHRRVESAQKRGLPLPEPPLPLRGTKITVPTMPKTTIGIAPASLCLHHQTQKLMATLIILGAEPWFVLSPWGNGPGYVCFLKGADINDEIYEIEVIESKPHGRSALAVPGKGKRK